MVTVTFERKHIDILAQATTAEYLGLIFWLALVSRPDGGLLTILGIALLFAGFFLERLAVVRGMGFGTPLYLIALSAAFETVLWVAWLGIADRVSTVAAGAVLYLFIILEHSIQLKAGSTQLLREYLTSPVVLFFSLVEAIGAVIWLLMFRSELAIVSGFVMYAALLLEHIIQGIYGLATRPMTAAVEDSRTRLGAA